MTPEEISRLLDDARDGLLEAGCYDDAANALTTLRAAVDAWQSVRLDVFRGVDPPFLERLSRAEWALAAFARLP